MIYFKESFENVDDTDVQSLRDWYAETGVNHGRCPWLTEVQPLRGRSWRLLKMGVVSKSNQKPAEIYDFIKN